MKQLLQRLSLILLSLVAPDRANAKPAPDLADIAYRQKPGARLPLQSAFRNEDGRDVRLADVFGRAPVVLVLGYFRCAKLCGVLRGDVLSALRESGLAAGKDYEFIALSIDPQETDADAAAARTSDLERFPTPGAQEHRRYLTSADGAARTVAEAVGYFYRYEGESKIFAHPVGVAFIRADGVVSNYLLGLGHRGADMQRAIGQAAAGEIASTASPVMLLCFDFDSTNGRYTLAIIKLLRLAAIATIGVMGFALFRAFRHEGTSA